MIFPTFLLESNPRSFTDLIVIINLHTDHGTDSSEGEKHGGDQRSVTKPNRSGGIDAIEKLPSFHCGQDGSLSAFNHVLRPANGRRGIHRYDLTDNKPIHAHANSRQMLFNGRLGIDRSKVLDVRSHDHRFDIDYRNVSVIEPSEEVIERSVVGFACISVSNIRREELKIAANRFGATGRDQNRDIGRWRKRSSFYNRVRTLLNLTQ